MIGTFIIISYFTGLLILHCSFRHNFFIFDPFLYMFYRCTYKCFAVLLHINESSIYIFDTSEEPVAQKLSSREFVIADLRVFSHLSVNYESQIMHSVEIIAHPHNHYGAMRSSYYSKYICIKHINIQICL